MGPGKAVPVRAPGFTHMVSLTPAIIPQPALEWRASAFLCHNGGYRPVSSGSGSGRIEIERPSHKWSASRRKTNWRRFFMKAENISRMGDQVRENMADIADKARDLSAKVKERLDDTYNELGRTMRRARAAAEDRLDDVRSTVKDRPLASVAAV